MVQQPIHWMTWASIAMQAEAEAQETLEKEAAKRAKR